MRLSAVSCPCVLLATLIWAAGRPAPGQVKLETVSPTDPRRTPVVEVFHRWKDSVVYLTGPIATAPGPSIEEFFSVPSARRQTISIGSGFVVHESGFVVTNAHAVEWVIAHHATLADGRMYPAELVGLSPEYDLALLKISAGRPLHAVQLGKSGDFILGETIIVISNPAGLLHTCTSGIISAANREMTPNALPGVVLHGLMQTDASINLGSSGGPWFNVVGDVIGVTTAVKAGSTNIGFGIPVSAVRHTLPDMLDVERLYGIYTGLNTQALPQEPCVVAKVAARSPAAAADIQAGDVVKLVNGQTILGRCEFLLSLIDHKPGDVLRLELLRNDRPVSASLTLGRPAETRRRGPPAGTVRPGGHAVEQGQGGRHFPARRARRVDYGRGSRCVRQAQNPPQPDDVLARINNIRPRDLDHVGLLLDRLKPGDTVHFVFLRHERPRGHPRRHDPHPGEVGIWD